MEIPFDVEKEFGSKRPRIKAFILSRHISANGRQCHMVLIKIILMGFGKTFGDE